MIQDILMLPLAYPFMQHALIGALCVGVVCAVLSCFVVLKGWSLMGDATSHAVFLGVVVAAMMGAPLGVGAFIAAMFCALSVGYLKNHTRLKEDTLMGVVFSGMFAAALVLYTQVSGAQHLSHILFGNLLGISGVQLWQIGAVALSVSVLMLVKKRDFALYCFDVNHAYVAGLNVRALHYGLLALLSATIVTAAQAVGVILVVAMLISPGITAFVLTKRLGTMLMVAITSSVISSILGVFISYHLDSATGATIVLLQAIFFGLALIISKIRQKSPKKPSNNLPITTQYP